MYIFSNSTKLSRFNFLSQTHKLKNFPFGTLYQAKYFFSPKCRMEYKESEIPSKYVCFCGKSVNPDYQPWLIPHSCGEICSKDLQCGHKCTLLCHPGPCPICPKIVKTKCYCGKQPEKPMRCNAKEWSCGGTCTKKYKNCEHHCIETCHSGDCPPCQKVLYTSCNCGLKEEPRNCNEVFWKCDKICNRKLSCNVHVCEEKCHRVDDCGQCPLEKNRTVRENIFPGGM